MTALILYTIALIVAIIIASYSVPLILSRARIPHSLVTSVNLILYISVFVGVFFSFYFLPQPRGLIYKIFAKQDTASTTALTPTKVSAYAPGEPTWTPTKTPAPAATWTPTSPPSPEPTWTPTRTPRPVSTWTPEILATATADAGTAIAQERRENRADIENVVRRYGEKIKVENTTHLNSSSLSQVLVDSALERQKRSACWLENEGLYYTYDDRRFTLDSITLDNDWQATVLVRIQESRVLRNQDGSIYKDYGYEDYRAIYQLEKRSNNKWYIYCFQAFDGDQATNCQVKIEGDDPCR